MKIKPVILAGGFGTRLWPLSRQLHPKQFIKMFGELSLLQQTLIRNSKLGKPIVIIGEDHRAIAEEQINELAIDVDFVLEPAVKNTAPCAIIAALIAKRDGYDSIILIPSDHKIIGEDDYLSSIDKVLKFAKSFSTCTIGVQPQSANSTYGYIKIKDAIEDGVFSVERFVEKPEFNTALAYFAMSNLEYASYFWNSGIFVFAVDELLQEVQRNNATLFHLAYNSFTNAIHTKQFIKLNAEYYNYIEAISIDYAVVESLKQMVMIRADFGWEDIGSWRHLWLSRTKDAQKNYFEGNVSANNVTDSYISTGNKLVAVVGVDNLIVINTDDVVLIANKEKPQEFCELVTHLTSLNRQEVIRHTPQYRKTKYI